MAVAATLEARDGFVSALADARSVRFRTHGRGRQNNCCARIIWRASARCENGLRHENRSRLNADRASILGGCHRGLWTPLGDRGDGHDKRHCKRDEAGVSSASRSSPYGWVKQFAKAIGAIAEAATTGPVLSVKMRVFSSGSPFRSSVGGCPSVAELGERRRSVRSRPQRLRASSRCR